MMGVINQTTFNLSWSSILLPSNLLETMAQDIQTLKNERWTLQDEKMQAVVKRVLCLIGMAFASIIIGKVAWDLFWHSLGFTFKAGVSIAIYLVCRHLFESFQIASNQPN